MFEELSENIRRVQSDFEKVRLAINFAGSQHKECKKMLQDIAKEKVVLQKQKEEISKLIVEKTQGFPWLASAFSDYYYLESMKVASSLQSKAHPAFKSAQIVKEQAVLRREAEKKYRITKYYLECYHELFPFIEDFQEQGLDEIIVNYLEHQKEHPDEENFDRASLWLTPEEYQKLSRTEKNQLALDRYLQSRKTPWQVGRDYEMYCGFVYERKGYNVSYQGIIEGLEDLGRDLIAENNDEIFVIQCKCWSSHKVIREKHIMQLYGTSVKYRLEIKNRKKVVPLLITSTSLSDKAKEFAQELGVQYVEVFSMQDFPRIKCNLNKDEFGLPTKIYHLPFDQLYDRTKICKPGEFYATTVAEAERVGFRRAWRWSGE